MGVAGPVLSAAVPIISSAVTSYKVGKAIGEKIGDSIRDKTLTLINKHRHRLWVVVMYKNNYIDDWMVEGWFELLPFDSFHYSFIGIKNRIVYYWAKCNECDSTWGKGDSTGYVPTTSEAFTNFNSIGIGELKNFSEVNLRDDDVSIKLTGY